MNDDQRKMISDEAELPFAIAQLLFGPSPRGNVREKDTDSAILGGANTEGVGIVPAVQGCGAILKPDGLTAQRDVTVDLEPMLFVAGSEFMYGFASGIFQTGLFFESRIYLDKSVVHWPARGIEHDFDDAKARVDGIEQRTIPLRRCLESCTLPRKIRVGLSQRLLS
jgi:hypothetical protein